jgi:putative transposase
MPRQQFSKEQIMRILPAAEMLDNVREVCRQHNIAEQTLYWWRRQFGGLDVSEARRLRTFVRDERERLLSTLFVQVLLYVFLGCGQIAEYGGARNPRSPLSHTRCLGCYSCIHTAVEHRWFIPAQMLAISGLGALSPVLSRRDQIAVFAVQTETYVVPLGLPAGQVLPPGIDAVSADVSLL